MSIVLSLSAFLLVMGTWLRYLVAIPAGKVPAKPVGHVALQVVGIAAALAAFLLGSTSGLAFALLVALPASIALLMGAFFLWLLSQRKTPLGELKVRLGDSLLPFAATTSDGAPFHSDSLAGTRTLVKFFRGGW